MAAVNAFALKLNLQMRLVAPVVGIEARALSTQVARFGIRIRGHSLAMRAFIARSRLSTCSIWAAPSSMADQ